jgi:hypothetical protein
MQEAPPPPLPKRRRRSSTPSPWPHPSTPAPPAPISVQPLHHHVACSELRRERPTGSGRRPLYCEPVADCTRPDGRAALVHSMPHLSIPHRSPTDPRRKSRGAGCARGNVPSPSPAPAPATTPTVAPAPASAPAPHHPSFPPALPLPLVTDCKPTPATAGGRAVPHPEHPHPMPCSTHKQLPTSQVPLSLPGHTAAQCVSSTTSSLLTACNVPGEMRCTTGGSNALRRHVTKPLVPLHQRPSASSAPTLPTQTPVSLPNNVHFGHTGSVEQNGRSPGRVCVTVLDAEAVFSTSRSFTSLAAPSRTISGLTHSNQGNAKGPSLAVHRLEVPPPELKTQLVQGPKLEGFEPRAGAICGAGNLAWQSEAIPGIPGLPRADESVGNDGATPQGSKALIPPKPQEAWRVDKQSLHVKKAHNRQGEAGACTSTASGSGAAPAASHSARPAGAAIADVSVDAKLPIATKLEPHCETATPSVRAPLHGTQGVGGDADTKAAGRCEGRVRTQVGVEDRPRHTVHGDDAGTEQPRGLPVQPPTSRAGRCDTSWHRPSDSNGVAQRQAQVRHGAFLHHVVDQFAAKMDHSCKRTLREDPTTVAGLNSDSKPLRDNVRGRMGTAKGANERRPERSKDMDSNLSCQAAGSMQGAYGQRQATDGRSTGLLDENHVQRAQTTGTSSSRRLCMLTGGQMTLHDDDVHLYRPPQNLQATVVPPVARARGRHSSDEHGFRPASLSLPQIETISQPDDDRHAQDRAARAKRRRVNAGACSHERTDRSDHSTATERRAVADWHRLTSQECEYLPRLGRRPWATASEVSRDDQIKGYLVGLKREGRLTGKDVHNVHALAMEPSWTITALERSLQHDQGGATHTPPRHRVAEPAAASSTVCECARLKSGPRSHDPSLAIHDRHCPMFQGVPALQAARDFARNVSSEYLGRGGVVEEEEGGSCRGPPPSVVTDGASCAPDEILVRALSPREDSPQKMRPLAGAHQRDVLHEAPRSGHISMRKREHVGRGYSARDLLWRRSTSPPRPPSKPAVTCRLREVCTWHLALGCCSKYNSQPVRLRARKRDML